MLSLQTSVLVTAFGLTGFSTAVVCLRFYCRYVLVGAVKSYDYLVLAALLTTWAVSVTNVYQVRTGTGLHIKDLDPDPKVLETNLKVWYIFQLEYLFDLALIKFSVLCFYLVFATRRLFRFAIHGVIITIGVYTITMIFINAFECQHPSHAFSPETLFKKHGDCINLGPLFFGQAGFNILSDIAILILPMPTLLTLRMNKNKRLAVLSIFSIGLVAIMASAVRVYALHIWATHPDTYVAAYILIWTQVELNTGIVTASIPALKPLFRRAVFESAKSSPESSQDSKSTSQGVFKRPLTIGSSRVNPVQPPIKVPEAAVHGSPSNTRNVLPLSFYSRAYGYQDEYDEEGQVSSRAYADIRKQNSDIARQSHANGISEPWRHITKSVTIERKSTLLLEKIGVAI